jgi:uncharacterized heparinase superfamily protein
MNLSYLLRLIRTLWYVPPLQLGARLWAYGKRFYHQTPLYPLLLEKENVSSEQTLTPPNVWPGDEAKGQAIAKKGDFTFVGRTVRMAQEMNWLPGETPLLWRFNLHYWDWLADLKAARERETAQQLVEDWLLNCDRYHPVIWHPYPLSLRLVNGLIYGKWILTGASPSLEEAYWGSLQRQASHLSQNLEWDVNGNHLLKNIKALIFAGLCLPGRQSLFLEGQKLLLGALKKQILADGSHYERSPLYHVQVLQDLLDIQALLRKARFKRPAQLEDALDKMAEALAFYRYPDGKLALMNDSAEGSKKLLDVLAKKCGAVDEPGTLPDAGFVRLAKGSITLVMDVGRPGMNGEYPGHAHAQALAFELCVGKERIFVNRGTYAYQDPLRAALRATSAHNTVVVDGQNSAEVWGQFRMGRRPTRVEYQAKDKENQIVASHNGYRFLGVKHERRLTLSTDGLVLVGEEILAGKGKTPHRVKAYFHVHPDVKVRLKDEQHVLLTAKSGQKMEFAVKNGRIYANESAYAPQFGELQPAQQLVVQGTWRQGAHIEWIFRVQS